MFYPTDATVSLQVNTTEVLENEGEGSVELCAILDDLPAGGLECNVTANLTTTDSTASQCRNTYIINDKVLQLRHLYQFVSTNRRDFYSCVHLLWCFWQDLEGVWNLV